MCWAGRANEGLRADWQQQLAYVRKECGFKYIRMHGLLTDDMACTKKIKMENQNTISCMSMPYLIFYKASA
jgi:beta-xylosidase